MGIAFWRLAVVAELGSWQEPLWFTRNASGTRVAHLLGLWYEHSRAGTVLGLIIGPCLFRLAWLRFNRGFGVFNPRVEL